MEKQRTFDIPKTSKTAIDFNSFNLAATAATTITSGGIESSLHPYLYLSPLPPPPSPPSSLILSATNNNPISSNDVISNNSSLHHPNYFSSPIDSAATIDGENRGDYYDNELYAKVYNHLKNLKPENVNQAVIENIGNGINSMLSQNDNASKASSNIAQRYKGLHAALQIQKDARQKTDNELDDSQRKISKIEEENRNIEGKIQDQINKYNNSENIFNEQLQQEKRRHDNLLQQSQKLNKQNDGLKVNAKQQEMDLQTLKQKVEAIEADKNSEIQKRMEIEQKIEDENKALERQRAKARDAAKKSQTLEDEFENLKKVLEKKNEALNKMEMANNDLSKNIKENEDGILEAKSKINEANQRQKAAENELKKLKDIMEKRIQQVIEEENIEAVEEPTTTNSELNQNQNNLVNLFSETQRLNISQKKKVVVVVEPPPQLAKPAAESSNDQIIPSNPSPSNSRSGSPTTPTSITAEASSTIKNEVVQRQPSVAEISTNQEIIPSNQSASNSRPSSPSSTAVEVSSNHSKNESSNEATRKMMELVLFEENQKVSYYGKCKWILKLEENIIVISSDDNGLVITLDKFNHYFCQKDNVFIAFQNDNSGFALIFSNQNSCNEIFEIYKKLKQSSSVNGMAINKVHDTIRLFLIKIFYEIQNNKQKRSSRLIQITNNFFKSLSDKEKLDNQDIVADLKFNTAKVEVVDLTEEDEGKENKGSNNDGDTPPTQQKISPTEIEVIELSDDDEKENNANEKALPQPSSSLKRKSPSASSSSTVDQTSNEPPAKKQAIPVPNNPPPASHPQKSEPADVAEETAPLELQQAPQPLVNNDIKPAVNRIPISTAQNSNDQPMNLPAANHTSTQNNYNPHLPEPQQLQPQRRPISDGPLPSQDRRSRKMNTTSKEVFKFYKFKLEYFTQADENKVHHLTLFDEKTQELCRTYSCTSRKFPETFYCTNCKYFKLTVSLKIHEIRTHEISVTFGRNEHLCGQQPEGRIFDTSQIKIKKKGEIKISELTLFDDRSIYFFNAIRKGNTFSCGGCKGKPCHILLFEKDNGTNEYYAKWSIGEHSCVPLTYPTL